MKKFRVGFTRELTDEMIIEAEGYGITPEGCLVFTNGADSSADAIALFPMVEIRYVVTAAEPRDGLELR